MKELRNTRFYIMILISIMSIVLLEISPAFSLLTSNLTIRSSGTIVPLLPLQVEGRYIKDVAGNIVYLRGLQKVEFADDPDGIWMGDTYWKTSNVIAELDAMKSWGANTVRIIQAVEHWKNNMTQPYAAISNRQAIKQLLDLAAQRNMYVIYTGYRVTDYWNGGDQDPLPYPPYQTSQGASSIISNKNDFINWWGSVATELKNYPNVLFELWNEPTVPVGYDENAVRTEYFSVLQQTISAIRSTGAQQLILVQWEMNTWVNLDYPPPNSASTMDWITQANLVDPLNNLVYVTHVYREYGCTGIYSESSSILLHGSNHAWEYNEIKRAFQYEKLDWVINTLNKPLFVTETGCSIDQTGSALTQEFAAWNNTLTIFNEWGFNYIAHWWRDIGTFRLHNGPPNFTPTQGGTILKDALANKTR